jgi:monovalent cation/proton antiporter MnhG/PhaG subunit
VTPRDLIVDVMLAFGVGAQLICCFGVLLMRNVFDRLHYASAATTVGPVLIGAAVLLRESVSAGGLETIAIVSLLFLLNPVVEIATARAARRIEEPDA